MNTRLRALQILVALFATFSVAAAASSLQPSVTTLVDVVRAAIAEFQDPEDAIAAGWLPAPACVSGPQEGGMGVHFVNGTLVGDGMLHAERPEALVFEPGAGRMRLVAVEYIVLADAWNAANPAPPVLLGQQFHYVGSPNRYGLPAFYELHVWAWKQNPSGTFADWHPHVSCDRFTPGP